ncbi:pYEATS domain-containing protein [Bradyrhizobium japonicum]|uniref:pYEATS domain-containing protein n=1 Tax=Bradyrhizobium japonicum TaxID=375 RepID=UPI001BA67301|nr:pYEATS domain-containing protein [Bradyrhizobium japonicum]MBR0960213.1 TIR domain-containing protein [Bradyrhizobium japonicum]
MTTLKIAQLSEQIEPSYWGWSVWLEGSPEEIAAVEEVVWKLHPTFSSPEVRVTDRTSNFRLVRSGWGEFRIQADVRMNNGQNLALSHWLRLGPSAPTKEEMAAAGTGDVAPLGIEPGERPPLVFLSYTSSDARLAGAVAKELKRNHVDVAVDVDIPSGVNFRDWISEKIPLCDATVFLLPNADSAALSNSFTGYELRLAQKSDRPIIPILRSGADVPDQLKNFKAITVEGGPSAEIDVQAIARSITNIVR